MTIYVYIRNVYSLFHLNWNLMFFILILTLIFIPIIEFDLACNLGFGFGFDFDIDLHHVFDFEADVDIDFEVDLDLDIGANDDAGVDNDVDFYITACLISACYMSRALKASSRGSRMHWYQVTVLSDFLFEFGFLIISKKYLSCSV